MATQCAGHNCGVCDGCRGYERRPCPGCAERDGRIADAEAREEVLTRQRDETLARAERAEAELEDTRYHYLQSVAHHYGTHLSDLEDNRANDA